MLVHDFYTLQEFLSYFGSKNLAVNLDPSHMVLYGNDVAYAVRRLGKRIKHVHVKDAVGKPGTQNENFMFPMLGEGVTDWKGFFDALSEVGYDGFLSVEFESDNYLRNVWGGEWAKAAEASKQQTRQDHSSGMICVAQDLSRRGRVRQDQRRPYNPQRRGPYVRKERRVSGH